MREVWRVRLSDSCCVETTNCAYGVKDGYVREARVVWRKGHGGKESGSVEYAIGMWMEGEEDIDAVVTEKCQYELLYVGCSSSV